ncbi:MAG: hypothetical protein LBM25_05485 [Bacteroidales bacterium]|jgi:hypothetical protein|nr:hypothetical protein [Bacteroidales bacterium]
MKKIFFLLLVSLFCLKGFAQIEKLDSTYIYIDKDLVVLGINSNTTDEQLLDIRTRLLKYSTIRFTEFDVIREQTNEKDKKGKIQFISMEVDCRDGYVGKISHSFEKGDTSTWGFYRNYEKNSYKRAFYIGQLLKGK